TTLDECSPARPRRCVSGKIKFKGHRDRLIVEGQGFIPASRVPFSRTGGPATYDIAHKTVVITQIRAVTGIPHSLKQMRPHCPGTLGTINQPTSTRVQRSSRRKTNEGIALAVRPLPAS